jgi:hypothetical protein
MKRHRAAERALREATADTDTFEASALLLARGVGLGALEAFITAGWIVPDGPQLELRQLYRITASGKAALAAAVDADKSWPRWWRR